MGKMNRDASAKADNYLMFKLNSDNYGISILQVREIIGMLPITCVPRTPEHVKGVINLRGKLIPVIDLRTRLGICAGDYHERTCIVLVDIAVMDTVVQTGLVVDGVSEVLNIPEVEIEKAPQFGAALDTRFIRGMAKSEGKVKNLLEISEVLSAQDLSRVSEIAAEPTMS